MGGSGLVVCWWEWADDGWLVGWMVWAAGGQAGSRG